MHQNLLLDEIADAYQQYTGGSFSIGRLKSFNALTSVLPYLKKAQSLMDADAMFNSRADDAQLEQEFAFAIAQEAQFYALKTNIAGSMTAEVRNTFLCMKQYPTDSDAYFDYFEQLVDQIESLLKNACQELGISQGRRPQARWFLGRVLNGSESQHPFFRWSDA